MPSPRTNVDTPTFVVTMTLIAADVACSQALYRDVFGATVLRESNASLGEPACLRLGNIWISINVGGGRTDDKPEVIVTPPQHPNELSGFMNLRVTDIAQFYELWRSRGATLITAPKVHVSEIRCYIRDPDGYLIEVGQTTFTAWPLDLYS